MKKSVADTLSHELKRIRDAILESVGPYSRFVRLEENKLVLAQGGLEAVRDHARKVQNMVSVSR